MPPSTSSTIPVIQLARRVARKTNALILDRISQHSLDDPSYKITANQPRWGRHTASIFAAATTHIRTLTLGLAPPETKGWFG